MAEVLKEVVAKVEVETGVAERARAVKAKAVAVKGMTRAVAAMAMAVGAKVVVAKAVAVKEMARAVAARAMAVEAKAVAVKETMCHAELTAVIWDEVPRADRMDRESMAEAKVVVAMGEEWVEVEEKMVAAAEGGKVDSVVSDSSRARMVALGHQAGVGEAAASKVVVQPAVAQSVASQSETARPPHSQWGACRSSRRSERIAVSRGVYSQRRDSPSAL